MEGAVLTGGRKGVWGVAPRMLAWFFWKESGGRPGACTARLSGQVASSEVEDGVLLGEEPRPPSFIKGRF